MRRAGEAEAAGGADDAALLLASTRGDAQAFARLIERYYAVCHRVAWRMTGGHADCEDMVQETFLRLWRSPGQIREAKALKGWLLRAVSNRAIDRARARRPVGLDGLAEPAAPPDGARARASLVNEVDRAIARLPERQRQALVLVYFEAMSNVEAASAMAVSVEAIESLLARGRRGLKASLEDKRGDLIEDLGELKE